MSGEKVIYNLLSSNATLKAVVPTSRMFAGVIPIGATYPALCYNLVSDNDTTSIGMTVMKSLARVQVTAVATSYPAVKALLKLIEAACKNKQGTFNGVKTNYVLKSSTGADYRDDETNVFYSTIDFNIMYE